MARHKDYTWNLPEGSREPGGPTVHQWESIYTALLMDLRDELKKLNAVLACPHFQEIPRTLRGIRRNTYRPKRPTRKPG